MWAVKKDRSVAVSTIPKNCSTSIRNAFGESSSDESKDILDVPERIAFIREPFERLQSAYSFFYYLHEKGVSGDRNPSKEQVKDYESFVDLVLDGKPNRHWSPQIEMLMHDGEYIPTDTHKVDDIMAVWSERFPGLLPWQNACTHLPINDYRLNELEDYYKEDIELWRSL